MTTPAPEQPFEEPPPFQPIAAVLAVLLPGAGHAYLGETRRAVLIACGVLGLFFGGMFIGGIDVVDRQEDGVWFVGQSLVGPIAFATDYYHQHFLKVRDGQRLRSAEPYEIRNPKTGAPIPVRVAETGEALPFADPRANGAVRVSTPSDLPPNSKSVGRVNELGTLISAIAGMLNLICIIDAMFRHRVERMPGKGATKW